MPTGAAEPAGMRKHLLLGLAVTLLASPAVVPPAAASAAPPPGRMLAVLEALSPGMLTALRRDIGGSDESIAARLAVEDRAPRLEQRLGRELGADYAGSWIDEDGSALVVGVTDPARAAEVRAAGARSKLVPRSLAALRRIQDRLDRRSKVAAPAGVHGWWVEVQTNRVVVEATDAATAGAFVRRSGLAAEDVVVRIEPRGAQRRADIRGGDRYEVERYGGCSVGFAVSGGFLTAGHCGYTFSPTWGSGPNASLRQGYFADVTFPEADAAFVSTYQGWVPTPTVTTYDGGLLRVTGAEEASIGSSVCRSGTTSGWRCGFIKNKEVSKWATGDTVDPRAGYVRHLVEMDACSSSGDSGGSVVSGNQAQGIVSLGGWTGECGAWWPANTYYYPVNRILGMYGKSLAVSGSPTGPTASRLRSDYAGRCIDIFGVRPVPRVQLQVWDCNGGANQIWFRASTNTIMSMGLCMDLRDGATQNGTAVILAGCNGGSSQQFRLNANRDIISDAAHKCVDVQDWGTSNGSKLIIWDCTGRPNQKWTT